MGEDVGITGLSPLQTSCMPLERSNDAKLTSTANRVQTSCFSSPKFFRDSLSMRAITVSRILGNKLLYSSGGLNWRAIEAVTKFKGLPK
jgi:hypothetical protein